MDHLPEVTGARRLTTEEIEHRARVQMGFEQEKPLPDNAVIDLLCEVVRLVRERPEAPLPAPRANKPHDDSGWQTLKALPIGAVFACGTMGQDWYCGAKTCETGYVLAVEVVYVVNLTTGRIEPLAASQRVSERIIY